MFELGKAILGLGLFIVVIGALIMFAARFGLPLGRMPGDIAYRGKHVTVFFPFVTSILASIVLSLILYLISRFHR
jgi:uncharacterized membrane protein YvlD (DUF360 family)